MQPDVPEADDYTFEAAGPVFIVSRGQKVIGRMSLNLPISAIGAWFTIDDRNAMGAFDRYRNEVMAEADREWVDSIAAEDGVLALAIVREWSDAVGGRLGKLRLRVTSGESSAPPSPPTSGEGGD